MVMLTKTSSSYFLSLNDNLGNLITHVQLKGENYEEWSRAIRTALRAKKKLVFINGTMKKPDDESPDLEDLWTVNSMLVAWMFNTIEPTLRSTITHMKNTKDLWDDIKQHFSIGNGPRVQQLKADLADCKQRGQSIISYCGRLKMLWDELANYDQIPTCICSAYGTLRSNVLSTEPFPPLNRVYAMTIQEERIQDATQVKDKRDPVRFVVHANLGRQTTTRFEAKDRTITCFECNRTCHTSESCFEIIGYPEWWGDRPKTTGRGAGKGRGGSKSYGNGGRVRNMGDRANVAQVPRVGVTQETNVDKAGIGALSEDQWNVLVNHLNSHKSGNEKLTMDSLYVDDEVHQIGVESHSPHSPSNDSEDVDGNSESNKHVNDTESEEVREDFMMHTARLSPSAAPPLQSTSLGTPYPIAHYVNCDKFSLRHRCFLAAITTESDPNTFLEAIKALKNNGTWTITDLPPGKKVIGCKWVYKTKYNSNGTIERHKARLVILGNKQVEGIDYN
ncbi:retrovirus-related pol polyprotein from transposon TNT 1-94 [Tanacetum coccineum]